MQSHPTVPSHLSTDEYAPGREPCVAIFGRERNRVARLSALARSRRLDGYEAALPVSDDELARADLILIDGGELSPEDRLWIRGLIASTKDKPVIVATEATGFDGAVEMISNGVDDVLDWTTLTSAGLARAVRLTLARRSANPAGEPAARRPVARPRPAPSPTSLTLLQECASAILMVNPDGIVSFANPEAEHLLGVPEGSLAGSPFALEFDRDVREEVLLDGPDGRQVQAEIRIVETEYGGVPCRVVTLQDMTLRKALERHFAA